MKTTLFTLTLFALSTLNMALADLTFEPGAYVPYQISGEKITNPALANCFGYSHANQSKLFLHLLPVYSSTEMVSLKVLLGTYYQPLISILDFTNTNGSIQEFDLGTLIIKQSALQKSNSLLELTQVVRGNTGDRELDRKLNSFEKVELTAISHKSFVAKRVFIQNSYKVESTCRFTKYIPRL